MLHQGLAPQGLVFYPQLERERKYGLARGLWGRALTQEIAKHSGGNSRAGRAWQSLTGSKNLLEGTATSEKGAAHALYPSQRKCRGEA